MAMTVTVNSVYLEFDEISCDSPLIISFLAEYNMTIL